MTTNEGVNRATPVELRKSAEMANALIKAGVAFICVPYRSEEGKEALLKETYARLDRMAADAEGDQP